MTIPNIATFDHSTYNDSCLKGNIFHHRNSGSAFEALAWGSRSRAARTSTAWRYGGRDSWGGLGGNGGVFPVKQGFGPKTPVVSGVMTCISKVRRRIYRGYTVTDTPFITSRGPPCTPKWELTNVPSTTMMFPFLVWWELVPVSCVFSF